MEAPQRRYRLAVLSSHPIQYFAPLYRRLAHEPGLDVQVYYCSRQGTVEYVDAEFGRPVKWDVPLLDDYPYEFLPNLRRRDEVKGFTSLINPKIVDRLRRGRFDALWLHGYAYVSDWIALLTALLTNTAIFYRSEASLTYDRMVRRPLHIRLIKPLLLHFLFSRVSRFLSIGTANSEFYLHYGVHPERISHVPYVVDNDRFRDASNACRVRRDEIRSAMGIGPRDVVFLFAAKMTTQKAPLELLDAYRQIHDVPGKALIMIGEGELRSEAERYVHRHALHSVHFTGFVNQSQLPQYYAISDVFVRPDGIYRGDWGLTVNEAMAAGLTVITTDAIGATIDLVRDGENGLVVHFRDGRQLATAMRRLAEDPAACARMGRRSQEMIDGWSYDQCVEGVMSALRSLDRRASQ